MRFTITPFDDHGTPGIPDLVDLPTLKGALAEAAISGRRLHIRPAPRHHAPMGAQEET
ncbi:hypothetical protein [Kitasatospora sp. NPDC059571]|uniref:hypothetical protein n=1 Tax=Kitasatospora sp. NPDC059571 TaxID=3346871 RepID=UPI0036CFAB79